MSKYFKKELRKMGTFSSISNALISVLLCTSVMIGDSVLGKVSQFNFDFRHPFELRKSLPSSPRPEIIFTSGNSSLVSASNINPMGFDFSKLFRSSQQQQLRSPTYRSDEKNVIPLAWVNLPLFDTPVFSPHFTLPPPTARNVQNTSSIIASQSSKEESTPNNQSESRRRSTSSRVIKSDWDGRSSSEIFASEQNMRREDTSKVTVPQSQPVSTSPQPPPPTPHNSFERRIQLSNRGNNKQENVLTSRPPPIDVMQRQETLGNSDMIPIITDHSFAESKMQESRSSSGRSNLKVETSTTLAPIVMRIEQRQQPVAQKPIAKVVSAAPTTQRLSGPSSVVESHYQDTNSNYRYGYTVSNAETMDVKAHSESRQGQITLGEFSVLEPDGYTRIVKYTADASGFRASVKRVKV